MVKQVKRLQAGKANTLNQSSTPHCSWMLLHIYGKVQVQFPQCRIRLVLGFCVTDDILIKFKSNYQFM